MSAPADDIPAAGADAVATGELVQYVALYDYAAGNEDEFTFVAGDIIDVSTGLLEL